MLLSILIWELNALHDILVLLLSLNAIANSTFLFLPPSRHSSSCWSNPLLKVSMRLADVLFTWKSSCEALASQMKLTVELIVVLIDCGWTIISIECYNNYYVD